MSDAQKLDPKELPRQQADRRQLATELKEKANEAFKRRELLTATLHASDLLMLYPNERGYLDLFDEIVCSVDDPLTLLPIDTGAIHVATAAGRARVLMMQRRLPEALELLTAAVNVAPDLPYLHWVNRWLSQPNIIATLPWDLVFSTAVKTALTIAVGVPVPPADDDPRVPNLRAAAEYFAALKAHHPNESILWFGEALLRRRLGEPARTVTVAEEGVQRFQDDWRMRTALLNAYRDAERPDDAYREAQAAMEMDPSELSPLHDAAWAFLDSSRNDEAARLFDELRKRDPEYPGAEACFHYARWLSHRADRDAQFLIRMRERHWWDDQVRRFADEIDPPKPYLTVLPGPGDATASAARRFMVELAQVIRCCGLGGHVELGLNAQHLDSPSVGVAFDVAMKALGASGSLKIDVEEVQSPDPRTDKAQLSTRIWSYDGMTPVQAYPNGDARAQEAIADIARQVFRRESWDPKAREVAASFGNEGYHALVSVLTHPPIPKEDDDFDAFNWTWRCQVATAVVLSQLPPAWDASSARAALYSMVYGPSDWITGAAIIAFGWRVMENPALRAEVEPIFQWLRTQIPEKGFTAWEIVLAEVWLAMSDHDPEVKKDLRAWIDRYQETLHEKNRVRPPERRYGGLTIEEYARFSAERDKILSGLGFGIGAAVELTVTPPAELEALCEKFNVPLRSKQSGGVYPYIAEWQEALNANPELHDHFLEIQRSIELESMGVSGQEKAALDQIRDGNMDMHLRMAQAQQAQRAINEGDGGEADPLVFPGQPVAKLSDYVAILKGMQTGDMMGALGRYGLDMMSYSGVAQAWGAKLASDPVLTEKFSRMMQG